MEVATGAGTLLTILNIIGVGFLWKQIKTYFRSKRCKQLECKCECHEEDIRT